MFFKRKNHLKSGSSFFFMIFILSAQPAQAWMERPSVISIPESPGGNRALVFNGWSTEKPQGIRFVIGPLYGTDLDPPPRFEFEISADQIRQFESRGSHGWRAEVIFEVPGDLLGNYVLEEVVLSPNSSQSKTYSYADRRSGPHTFRKISRFPSIATSDGEMLEISQRAKFLGHVHVTKSEVKGAEEFRIWLTDLPGEPKDFFDLDLISPSGQKRNEVLVSDGGRVIYRRAQFRDQHDTWKLIHTFHFQANAENGNYSFRNIKVEEKESTQPSLLSRAIYPSFSIRKNPYEMGQPDTAQERGTLQNRVKPLREAKPEVEEQTMNPNAGPARGDTF